MSDGAAGSRRGLDATVVGGLGWTAGAKWATQFITWGSVLLLSRLLTPAEFGIADMAGFWLGLTMIVAEFGIATAVLQMRELDDQALRQMKTVATLFSAALFCVSVLVAPLIAAFFHFPQVRLLVMGGSLMLFFSALQSVSLGLLQRDLDYRRLAIAEMTMATVQAIGTVIAAWAGSGYWSMLIGGFAGRTAYMGLTSYWKPVGYSIPKWSQIAAPLRFSYQVAASRLASAAYAQFDALIVGRTLGPTALGSYRYAINFAAIPAEKIGLLLMRVTDPLFARTRNDKELVKRYLLIFNEMLALVISPLALGLAIVAPDLIPVLLGPGWQGVIGPMRWLALFLAFRNTITLLSQVLTSQRQTRFLMWVSVFNFVVMPAAFYVASRWGSSAIAAAWILMAPITVLPTAVKVLRTIECPVRDFVKVLAPPLTGCIAMACALAAMNLWLLPAGWPPFWRLVAQVAAGGAVYVGVLLGGYRAELMKYWRFAQQLRRDRAALSSAE